MTNGETLEYRIVGINHDDLADGTGKAGLTFEATNGAMGKQRMSDSYYNFGGWEQSELRGRLNSGDLWALLPAEIQSRAKAVTKMTDNKLDTYPGTVTATTDKVFLLSTTEVYGNLQANGHLQSDGSQYEHFAFKGVTQEKFPGLRPALATGLAPYVWMAPSTSAMSIATVTGATTATRQPTSCFPLGVSRQFVL